ncbi:MAG: peptidoglycan-binding domain-containing protein [Microcystis sp. LE19-84.1B]|jgi:peptidoglycan hydrolase-like protein with peptidoglycan-binding domain|nr:peptidoglycan-binding domain-containing protein [Microcystis sp. LE19-84.1B]MCZ8224772.1 peptidoglycan-binding domain-containing protein [Microcystis sp. LE19-84.1B]
MKGDDVKAVQKKLIEKGFSVGDMGADGFFGQGTAQAVIQFQDQANLDPVDGIVGDRTKKALGLSA